MVAYWIWKKVRIDSKVKKIMFKIGDQKMDPGLGPVGPKLTRAPIYVMIICTQRRFIKVATKFFQQENISQIVLSNVHCLWPS